MKATLTNPLLVWIYSTALLLIGCGVGRHWLHTPALWLCSIGGVLMAVHDLVTGFLWFFVTARWVRTVSPNVTLQQVAAYQCSQHVRPRSW